MRAAALALALLAAAGAHAQIPDGGHFATTEIFCDCDPVDFVFRTQRSLEGHAAPEAASRVVRTVDAGRLIEGNDWTEARTVVTRPAQWVLTAPVEMRSLRRMPVRQMAGTPLWMPVWERGADVPVLRLAAGTRVTAYDGEAGGSYFSTGGTLYYGDDFSALVSAVGPDATARADDPPPEQTLWLRLRARPGKPAAWVEIGLAWGPDAPDPAVEMLCSTHTECPPGVGPAHRPGR